MKFLDQRPIIACSTGNFANTAIALIRLSGFRDLLSLQSFFDYDLSKCKPRYNHLVNIIYNDSVIDNCLISFYPNGKSFTGENVLELQVHGNKFNVDRILKIFLDHADFRLADPGEFSYRAFLNKKLTLTQVEGLDLFLNASSSLMLDQGLDILQGQLHQSYLNLYDLFLKLKSSVELLIDFSEDVGEEYARSSYLVLLGAFATAVDSLSLRSQGNFSTLMNPEIVISGETNAGKSSFFNLLVKQNRAIVSPIKGTTRDYISEIIFHDSTNFVLVDTAGIRETFDEIEKIGISRSFEKLKSAFYKILLIDPNNFDLDSLKNLSKTHFDLIIFTHANFATILNFPLGKLDFLNCDHYFFCDLLSGSIGPDSKSGSIGPDSKSGSIGPESKSGSIGPDSKSGSIGPVPISGSIGPIVLNLINEKYKNILLKNPILLDRHRHKINELATYLQSNYSDLSSLDDLAITSSEINRLGLVVSELIGQVSSDDVLNSVFDNFCIGK